MESTVPASRRARHREWLLEVTGLPTAAGKEDAVQRWLDRRIEESGWPVRQVKDRLGNRLILQRGRDGRSPLLITAHLDHPAFVWRSARGGIHTLEFRGGVHDPYFVGSRIEIFDTAGTPHAARIVQLDAKAKPYKRVRAELVRARGATRRAAPRFDRNSIGRWLLPKPTIDRRGMLRTNACDDLAAVAAACAAFDEIIRDGSLGHVGLLFTTAEEVGFVGAIHAARTGLVPRGSRLLCLENSRSFPHDSPIGAGPILRVGDRMSVFSPGLTNRLGDLFAAEATRDGSFRFQRKLMPGGSCEATAFALHGCESTCLCLPLGNYHNMRDIDRVLAGRRPARVGQEEISVGDFDGFVRMLLVAARGLDSARLPDPMRLMDTLHARRKTLA